MSVQGRRIYDDDFKFNGSSTFCVDSIYGDIEFTQNISR